jgi:hypothetical protein
VNAWTVTPTHGWPRSRRSTGASGGRRPDRWRPPVGGLGLDHWSCPREGIVHNRRHQYLPPIAVTSEDQFWRDEEKPVGPVRRGDRGPSKRSAMASRLRRPGRRCGRRADGSRRKDGAPASRPPADGETRVGVRARGVWRQVGERRLRPLHDGGRPAETAPASAPEPGALTARLSRATTLPPSSASTWLDGNLISAAGGRIHRRRAAAERSSSGRHHHGNWRGVRFDSQTGPSRRSPARRACFRMAAAVFRHRPEPALPVADQDTDDSCWRSAAMSFFPSPLSPRWRGISLRIVGQKRAGSNSHHRRRTDPVERPMASLSFHRR